MSYFTLQLKIITIIYNINLLSKALVRSGLDKKYVEEVFMGNVVSAGIGQAPSRQATIYAGLDKSVSATDINKVCAR